MEFASVLPSLRGRDLLSLADLSREEILGLLELGERFSRDRREGFGLLNGAHVGLVFAKPSTRTRVSFEVAVGQLGGRSLYFNAADLQLGRGETIADTGMVLSGYLEAVVIRTFHHADVVELARAASIPVINALTDLTHPCQGLADLLTVRREKGRLEGLKVAYLGDGNNVAHSLILGGGKVGLEVAVATPAKYRPDAEVLAGAAGGRVWWTEDPAAAAGGADVIYTDVWTSMGQEGQEGERRRLLEPYRVTEKIMALARPGAIFMHCLPAHRGEEVEAVVLDGSASRVFVQAENRLHVQKALLAAILG